MESVGIDVSGAKTPSAGGYRVSFNSGQEGLKAILKQILLERSENIS